MYGCLCLNVRVVAAAAAAAAAATIKEPYHVVMLYWFDSFFY